jgi:hypothetical protein
MRFTVVRAGLIIRTVAFICLPHQGKNILLQMFWGEELTAKWKMRKVILYWYYYDN